MKQGSRVAAAHTQLKPGKIQKISCKGLCEKNFLAVAIFEVNRGPVFLDSELTLC
jgi:hypothetical protein